MKKFVAFFVAFAGFSALATVPVGMGQVGIQPVVSLKLSVTEADMEERIEAAFEKIEEDLDEAEAEYSGLSFVRILTEEEVEPFVVEVGFLVTQYPVSLPVAMRSSLPGGLALGAMVAGEEADLEPAYAAMELFMARQGLTSREMPWEIYSAEKESWTRVVWPVLYESVPAPIPAP